MRAGRRVGVFKVDWRSTWALQLSRRDRQVSLAAEEDRRRCVAVARWGLNMMKKMLQDGGERELNEVGDGRDISPAFTEIIGRSCYTYLNEHL